MTKRSYQVGDFVTFDYYGRPTTGRITGFEVQTDKWSNQAGKRIPRKTPVTFASVLVDPGTETRGSGSISEYLRKLRPATPEEIATCKVQKESAR